MTRRWITFMSCLLVACGEHGDHAAPSTVPLDGIGPAALFVVNGGDATLTVIDPATDAVVGEIVLEGVEYPHHASYDASGDRLFVAVPGTDLSGGHGGHAGHDTAPVHGMVLALAAGTGELVAYHELGASNHNAIISPSGEEVWTSESGEPGAVVVLDAVDLRERERITVGDAPSEVSFSGDGRHAFVCNTGAGTVSVIDTATKAVVTELTVGTTPVGAWPGGDGNLYVDNEGSETLSVISGDALAVVSTVELGFVPAMAAVTAGGELWVTAPELARVVAFASAMPEAGSIRELAVGAGAHAIAFSPDATKAYVTNQDAGTVSVVDVTSGEVVATVAVGTEPNGMALRRP